MNKLVAVVPDISRNTKRTFECSAAGNGNIPMNEEVAIGSLITIVDNSAVTIQTPQVATLAVDGKHSAGDVGIT